MKKNILIFSVFLIVTNLLPAAKSYELGEEESPPFYIAPGRPLPEQAPRSREHRVAD